MRSGTQRAMQSLSDSAKADALVDEVRAIPGQQLQVEQLRDLRDPGTNHAWLWELGRKKQEALPAEEFVICLRLRLGAA